MINKHKFKHLDFLPLIIISFILFKIIQNIEGVGSFFKLFTGILLPFIWAFCIAYILNPLMKYIEKNCKLKRWTSILITYILVIGLIILFINILIPTIINNLSELFLNAPHFVNQTINWFNDNVRYSDLYNILTTKTAAKDTLPNLLGKLTTFTNSFINGLLNTTIRFTSSLFKFMFGFIIAIYLLLYKENLIYNIKRFSLALLGNNRTLKLSNFINEVDSVFCKYIIGKSIDSLIIGALCFIGLTLIKAPYPALLSFIVGLTNMIPYFGPFIGMIPAFIITLFFGYMKAIWVLIFIVILQQFDGWYLGPKILGSQIGLNPIWIIFAITIGGGLWGVLGMFLSVPVVAVIKIYLSKYIDFKLNKKL